MASRSSSKRSRSSESPTWPDAAASLSSMPVGAQNLSLSLGVGMQMEPADMIGVQVRQKKRACNPKSIMSLGLSAKSPAEKSSLPGFGEFLKVCRWCKKKIGGGASVYMFGNFHAFCKPECREIVASMLYEQHLFESGLDEDKRIEDVKKKPM